MGVGRMKNILLSTCFAISLAYAGVCLYMFLSQRSRMYFPTGPAQADPAATATLSVADASLKLSVRPREGSDALIYFGGNAEDVSQSLGAFADAFPGYAIYMLHYRGYGGSSGKPSEAALHADAHALFDMVRARHPNIVLIGRSLGSGIAVRLAATRPVSRIVLVTPYDSFVNLAKRQFPYLPVNLLLQDKYESWRYAPLIKTRTLILAAENDEVIPRESTLSLFDAFAPGVASMRVIAGTGHNSISSSGDYWSAMQRPE
jgi:hypothetical protein